jgi:predicted  nucleic acid-binding Zn-ribbon protein
VSDYESAEKILEAYSKQAENEIAELNKTIVALRTKIIMLNETIQGERELANAIPVPPSVISQIADLNAKVQSQSDIIEYLNTHVSDSVIINKERKYPPKRRGGLR